MFLTCFSVSSGQAGNPSDQLARERGILGRWGSEAQRRLAGDLSNLLWECLLMCIQFLCPFLVSFSRLCFWPWALNLTFVSVIIFSSSSRLSLCLFAPVLWQDFALCLPFPGWKSNFTSDILEALWSMKCLGWSLKSYIFLLKHWLCATLIPDYRKHPVLKMNAKQTQLR